MARFLAFALAALTLLAAAACGGGDETQPAPETVEGTVPAETGGGGDGDGGDVEGDPEAGAEVFASAGCGSCHTLSDAGTSGAVGPNLDESSASYDQALTQIQNGGGGMPAYSGQLSEEEIMNVAAYVVTARG